MRANRRFSNSSHKAAGAAENNPHLFAGAAGGEPEFGGYAPGMGFVTPGKLNTTFARHLKKHCRLRLCLHVMRHISGKVILDQDPSAMALVQVVRLVEKAARIEIEATAVLPHRTTV